MALSLFNSVLNYGDNYDKKNACIEYMRMCNGYILKTDKKEKHSTFLGKNTKALFYGVRTLGGYKKRYDKRFKTEDDKMKIQANGCLMRCYPLAIFKYMYGDKVNKWIEDDV